jgi:DNA (cytosine-5)-methyltransferase 1
MRSPQFILPIADEMVVDLFAGGGGASTGIEQAIGRHVDIAVNHDRKAVAQHFANHPQTRHYCADVFEVDAKEVTDGRPVGLLWASPDCKHFSKAKGGQPRSGKIRALADVIAEWAEQVRPRVICMENVEEFATWGELDENGRPIPELAGLLFQRWKARIEAAGYVGEFRVLKACDYGTPTIRKRLFGVFRCDGEPIVWPSATHAKEPTKGSGLKPYRTAAECIDWSIPAPSIFERARPLAPATMRRIAHGIKRYVLEAAKPFIVPITHTADNRVHPIDEPMRTLTTAKRGELSLVAPTLIQTGYGERPGQAPRVPGLDKPLGTMVDGQKHGLVTAFLAKHFGGEPADGKTHTSLDRPAPTVLAQGGKQALVTANLIDAAHGDVSPSGVKRWGKGHRDIEAPAPTATAGGGNAALVTSNLVKLRGTSNSAATDEPLGTVSAGGMHHAEVRAFLIRYFGTDQDPRIDDPLATITTKHRDAVVTVHGQDYLIADIGMRMLQPRELYRAQGFPDSYIIEWGTCHVSGQRIALTKEQQVKSVGNSVCPPLARAIVLANYVEAGVARRVA